MFFVFSGMKTKLLDQIFVLYKNTRFYVTYICKKKSFPGYVFCWLEERNIQKHELLLMLCWLWHSIPQKELVWILQKLPGAFSNVMTSFSSLYPTNLSDGVLCYTIWLFMAVHPLVLPFWSLAFILRIYHGWHHFFGDKWFNFVFGWTNSCITYSWH